jgi:catalase
VAGLRNVDETLARGVADGLGLDRLPRALSAARQPLTDLAASPALSILGNGPKSFTGRKLGVVVTDGAELAVLDALTKAVVAAQATMEVVAPRVGGVLTSDKKRFAADKMLAGAPSVLYDAVAIISSPEGAAELATSPAARDFVADAYAHAKFVGYVGSATPLFAAAGLETDEGFVRLDKGRSSAQDFLRRCGELRYWERTGTS